MPYAPETRRKSLTGTSKASKTQEIVDLFGFAGLHQLGMALDDLMARPGQRGQHSSYPATALLAATAAARAAHSRAGALKILSHRETWERCRANYAKYSNGVRLPHRAPTYDQIDYFRGLLTEDPQVMARLQHQFQRVSLGQARKLGNLVPRAADGCHPDERNSIYTDGTVIAPYSDVALDVHPLTGELFTVGSRAKHPANARVQHCLSDMSLDGKCDRGLNMVGVYTWTRAGRVVLATGTAMGAEQWTVLDLIDSLHTILSRLDTAHELTGGAIHTLINDRAITGWSVDYLMGALGIQVLGKAVGRSAGESNVDMAISEMVMSSRVLRRAAEFGVQPSANGLRAMRHDELSDMGRSYRKLPLGVSLYPTTNKFDLVHSKFIPLPPATHDVNGTVCEHPLAVDDGALFLVEVDEEEGDVVKSALLPCQSSTRVRETTGRWGTRNHYTIPCADGAFTYERTWQPRGTRFTADSTETDRAPKDHVGWQLRPLNRADDVEKWINHDVDMSAIEACDKRFSRSFSRRNDAEAYNAWYRERLPRKGRAASLSTAGQELDFLLAGVLNNSITWRNHKS
ncbi:hypothetical protein [Janibacter sp. DB-40]|uniref:hypothetical protein n=1 Tax=Janibacter sp. DB-40 TaxID=3028808 RepID=UPI002404DEBF|nr:hypothetical protein [Janibacter sp. DB-40]